MFLHALASAGVIGVLLRYSADLATQSLGAPAPLGTFSVNALGCFLAGILYVVATERGLLSDGFARILIVGFCGGFTTFSTYALQSALFFERGQFGWLALYLGLSPIIGLGATLSGFLLARHFA